MINLLQEKYRAKASCSHVSQDGYEVGNLIAESNKSSFFSRQGGFLAEYFIKPPVDINLFFPLPIHISSIELGLSVGAQTTDGIEILVTEGISLDGVFRVVYRQCPITVKYLKISNASFRTRPPFCVNEKTDGQQGTDKTALFKFTHLLKNVKVVRVRIIKTHGSSVPALGSVKVFGIPGIGCEPAEWERILQSNGEESADSKDDDIQILSVDNLKIENHASPTVQIPEEFLDPLTCEVMALPMLLPSGHSVDSSTLEKANNSQASWGRLPCDPFTGIPFGPGRKPVSNIPLKARIDAFLVKNSSLDPQLASIPRSLGTKPKVPQNDESIKTDSSISAVSHITADNSLHNSEIASFVSNYNPNPDTNHETALQNSLDIAMKAFYKTPGQSRQVNVCKQRNVCAGCKLSNSLYYYKLPCEHLLCRKCLLQDQNACPQCHKLFLKEQVHRTYKIP